MLYNLIIDVAKYKNQTIDLGWVFWVWPFCHYFQLDKKFTS